jgi:glycosyltransferase involved in cell wall biosynthesis
LPALLLVFTVVWGLNAVYTRSLNHHTWLTPESGEGEGLDRFPSVSVISAARNEAVGIEAAVRSLAALDYPAVEILVVDDHSTDGTPQILQRLGRELPKVRALEAPALGRGWTGKNWAAWSGYRQASPSAEWLLFVDARVTFHPKALTRSVGYAEKTGLDFLSCVFLSKYGSLTEELLGPLQIRMMMEALPVRRPERPPVGIGAFMLIRRRAYEASGGHSANPANALDDTMLAVSTERCGGKCGLAIAPRLLQLRRYHGYRDMRTRVVRAMRLGCSDLIANQANQIALDLLLYVIPVPLLFWGILRQVRAGFFSPVLTAQVLLLLLIYLAGVWAADRSRALCAFRRWVCWLHPVGALLRVWLRLLAVTEKVRGQEVTWRARPVPVPKVFP